MQKDKRNHKGKSIVNMVSGTIFLIYLLSQIPFLLDYGQRKQSLLDTQERLSALQQKLTVLSEFEK